MDEQKSIIRDTIEKSGWQITKIDSDEWWVREMWQLQSDETTAFVTFLVDPANMELVWAVLGTKEKPIDYAGEPPRHILPVERFETDLNEFGAFLEKCRLPVG